MKKIILYMAVFLIGLSLSACGENVAEDKDDGKISIVTTIFPEYDWVRQIVGDNDNVEITLLLDSGVDLHSFQPNADDIFTVTNCDMFVYTGGESDKWVEDVLEETQNKDMIVVDLKEVLGDSVKEEEIVEGMEEESGEAGSGGEGSGKVESDEAGSDAEASHTDGEIEYDEHIWLSLRNAQVLCRYISDKMIELDVTNADSYRENASDYIEQLDAMDRKYQEMADSAPNKTIVFGDRFPFRYLADDYGLDYYAAFAGCSAESEASFETITFLASKVDELQLHAIFRIEGSNGKIADIVKENTQDKNQVILTLNSMQGITSKDVDSGITYLGLMQDNLEVLEEGLR